MRNVGIIGKKIHSEIVDRGVVVEKEETDSPAANSFTVTRVGS